MECEEGQLTMHDSEISLIPPYCEGSVTVNVILNLDFQASFSDYEAINSGEPVLQA